MQTHPEPDVARSAALFADRSRVAMLLALGDGKALPAGELARAAGVGRATASAHLKKLRTAGLVDVVRQGRHRYFRLVGAHAAELMEALAALAPATPPVRETSRVAHELRFARWCYGHVAGVMGVAVARALADRGALTSVEDGCAITPEGRRWAAALGLALPGADAPAVRLCLVDWSERRPHVAGALGRALARRLVDTGCLVPVRASRALRLTERGRRWFREQLGLEW
jgi:DNA-binding transcriptional ArsR family regulator